MLKVIREQQQQQTSWTWISRFLYLLAIAHKEHYRNFDMQIIVSLKQKKSAKLETSPFDKFSST